MKKLIYNEDSRMNDAKYLIEIVFNYDYKSDDVAASERVKHPLNINKKFKMSDSQLQTYNDLVDSMIAPLIKRKFIINSEYQSKRSYAYYIDFYPIDREGNRYDESVRLLFRASDHAIQHGEEGQLSEDLVLKSFLLFGEEYKDPFALQRKVIDICEHLMDGDFMYVVNIQT